MSQDRRAKRDPLTARRHVVAQPNRTFRNAVGASTSSGLRALNGSANGTSGAENQAHSHNFTTDGGAVGGAAHNVMQPTILANCIMRIV